MAAGSRRRSRPSLLLLLLCLGLGALVYHQVRSDYWSRLPPAVAAGPPAEVVLPEPLPEFQLPPLSDFAATVERPLFLADRRPPEPEDTVEATPEKAQPLEVIVTGVIISEAGRFALVRREGATEILRLSARDTIDGWSVEEIRADRVVFARDDESLEVELKDLAQPAPPRGRDARRRAPAEAGAQPPPGTGERGQAASPGTPASEGRNERN